MRSTFSGATHDGLEVADLVECTDPGDHLGLIMGERYVVIRVLDPGRVRVMTDDGVRCAQSSRFRKL